MKQYAFLKTALILMLCLSLLTCLIACGGEDTTDQDGTATGETVTTVGTQDPTDQGKLPGVETDPAGYTNNY